MASADYRLCDVCDGKSFYDANLDYPGGCADLQFDPRPAGCGDWSVLCDRCAQTHETVVRPKAVPTGELSERPVRGGGL